VGGAKRNDESFGQAMTWERSEIELAFSRASKYSSKILQEEVSFKAMHLRDSEREVSLEGGLPRRDVPDVEFGLFYGVLRMTSSSELPASTFPPVGSCRRITSEDLVIYISAPSGSPGPVRTF